MLLFNYTKFKGILVKDLGYPARDSKMLDNTCRNIHKLSSELQKTLDVWMENRTIIDDIEIEGITINKILACQDRFMRYLGGLSINSFVEALYMMNSFIENPEYVRKNKRIRCVLFGEEIEWLPGSKG